MGYRYTFDKPCKVCGRHTEYYCDACGLYVCEEHMVVKEAKHTLNKLMFCPECAKKGKKALDPSRRISNPAYI